MEVEKVFLFSLKWKLKRLVDVVTIDLARQTESKEGAFKRLVCSVYGGNTGWGVFILGES